MSEMSESRKAEIIERDGMGKRNELNDGLRSGESAGLLMSFYGDDFTGSTDSMEALALGGVKTVLFLAAPTRELLASRFGDVQAFGVAGVSRALAPDEMERELLPIFTALRGIPATIVHYKMCSTFDSSKAVGSIGRAIDIGADVFGGQRTVPLLVGAPQLRRYTLFGNHYASVGEHTYRLDRHPTMSRHPVTPMDEADLRVHLAKQTNKTISLMDILDLDGDAAQVRSRWAARMSEQPGVMLLDVLDERRLERAGALLWEEAARGGARFVVGSSGVEYALTAHWRATGRTPAGADLLSPRGPVDRLLTVSGSCSPVTEGQIRHALAHGFVGIPVEPTRMLDDLDAEALHIELATQAGNVLQAGRSPLLYTAVGPEDEAIGAMRSKLERIGRRGFDTSRLIGERLGRLTRDIVAANKLKRFAVAGGDTSGFVTRELGIYALEAIMPIAPGGPLCRSYAEDPAFDGLELVLKGGQVGKDDFFVKVKEGR